MNRSGMRSRYRKFFRFMVPSKRFAEKTLILLVKSWSLLAKSWFLLVKSRFLLVKSWCLLVKTIKFLLSQVYVELKPHLCSLDPPSPPPRHPGPRWPLYHKIKTIIHPTDKPIFCSRLGGRLDNQGSSQFISICFPTFSISPAFLSLNHNQSQWWDPTNPLVKSLWSAGTYWYSHFLEKKSISHLIATLASCSAKPKLQLALVALLKGPGKDWQKRDAGTSQSGGRRDHVLYRIIMCIIYLDVCTHTIYIYMLNSSSKVAKAYKDVHLAIRWLWTQLPKWYPSQKII